MNGELWPKLFQAISRNDVIELRNAFGNCKITDKNCTDKRSGDTALHLACKLASLDIVRILVEEYLGSLEDLEAVNLDRRTCLHEAVNACNLNIVTYLLEKGANVDAVKRGEWTPLMLACTIPGSYSSGAVKLLLSFGANPKAQNKDGWTPVNLAVRIGDETKINLLMSADRDAVFIKTKNQRTVLHTAALHGRASAIELLLMLDSRCKDMLCCADVCGVTPFLDAATSGSLVTVKAILVYHNALGDRDKKGLSALHHAARAGSLSVIEFLVKEKETDVNIVTDIEKVTPLHIAVHEKQAEAIKLFIKLGANAYLADAHGRCAMDYGATCMNPDADKENDESNVEFVVTSTASTK